MAHKSQATPSEIPTRMTNNNAQAPATNGCYLRDLGRAPAVIVLVIILAIGGAIRIRYLGQFDSARFEMMGDNAHHFNIAHNIAAGRGPVTDFIFAYWFRHSSIPAMSDFYPPGYHYSVAAAFLVLGESIETARTVSLLWSLVSIWALYMFACAVFGRGVGVLSAALWAFNRVEITHSVAVMAESQFNALFLLGAWMAVLSYRASRAWMWATTGLFIGAAALTKGLAYPLLFTAVLLLAASWLKGRHKLLHTAGMLILVSVCYALPQAYWAYQTKQYFGKPLFSHGYSVMISNDWAKSTYRTARPTLAEYLSENPGMYPLATRLRHIAKTLRALPLAVTYGIPGAFIVMLGVWLTRGKTTLFLVGTGVLYYAFVLLAAGGDMAWRERYLLPTIAFMCVIAGGALARFTVLLPRSRPTAAWVAVIAVTTVVAWLTLHVPFPPQDLQRTMAYERLGVWLKTNDPSRSPIMCIFVQDVYYATGHPCVMDATRYAQTLARLSLETGDPQTYARRSTEEARYYRVHYLMVDPNISQGETFEGLAANLPGLTLERVYADSEYPLWLYAIHDPEMINPSLNATK